MKEKIIIVMSTNLPYVTNDKGEANLNFQESLNLFGLEKLQDKKPSGKETSYPKQTFFTVEDIKSAEFTDEELTEFCHKRIVYGLLCNLSVIPITLIFDMPNGKALMDDYEKLRKSPFIEDLRKEYIEYEDKQGVNVPKLKDGADLGKITREFFEIEVKDKLSVPDYIAHFFQSFKRALMEGLGYSCPITEDEKQFNDKYDKIKAKSFSDRVSEKTNKKYSIKSK